MQNKQLRTFLTPSWITNFVGLAVGILVTLAAIVLSRYQNSQLQQEIFENNTGSSTTAASTHGIYQNITANVAHNSFLANMPLLLVWAAIGLVVYYFSIAIYKAFSQAADLREQLGYVHSSRQALLREAAFNLAIRIVVTLGWFVFIKLTVSIFVPYALAAADIAGLQLDVASVGYALLAVAVLYCAVYLHTLFLRLIVLRPRLFG